MANPLDWLGRAALRMGGMSPQQIRQQARANKKSKPMPKAKASKPQPETKAADKPKVQRQTRVHGRVKPGLVQRTVKPSPPKPPKPPAPGSIDPKGQTSLLKKDGTARDFRKPAQSANRPPTLDPVQQRSRTQATPPKPPIGGPGRQSPGQGYLNLGAGERTGNKDPWGPGTKPNRASLQSKKPQKAPNLPKEPPKAAAKPSVKPAGPGVRLGKAALGSTILTAIAGKAADTLGKAADIKEWERVQQEIKQRQADFKAPKPQQPKPGQKGAVSPQSSAKTKSETVGSNKPTGTTGGKAKPTEYSRPKPNIKPPSAAQQATDKRDKKKLF